MPFGYLEFSRAIRGKSWPHVRARRRWRQQPAGAGAGPGSGSGSLPGPVLFEPGLTGMGYRGSYPLRHPDPNRPPSAMAVSKPLRTVGRLLSETNRCNGSDRTVATVRLDSDHYTPPGAL